MITDYGVKALIGAGLRGTKTPMSDAIGSLAKDVESNLPAGQAERLDFLGAVPALREWVGTREAKQVAQQFFSAVMKKYEATVNVAGEIVRNDKTGQVAEIASGVAARKSQWRTKLIFDALNAGTGTMLGAAFDGLSYFNGAHTWNGQIYNNSLSFAAATGTTPTANEAADAICAAIQALYSFVDDQGQPLNEGISALTLVVGTTIGNAHVQAVNQSHLDTGTGVRDNPVMGWAKALKLNVLISPRYTSATTFALINSSPDACPFVFLENPKEAQVSMLGVGSDYEFNNDAWLYGVKAVGTATYGRFTDAVLNTYT